MDSDNEEGGEATKKQPLLFSNLKAELMELERQLSRDDIKKIVFVSKGIEERIAQRIKQETTLAGIKSCIENKLSTEETDTFLFHVLDAFGFSLKDVSIDPDLIATEYPGVDFRLATLDFLYALREIDFKSLEDSVCTALKVDHVECEKRCDLADLMMEESQLDHTSIAHLTAMVDLGKVYNHQDFFIGYCRRQNMTLENESIDNGTSEPVTRILKRITEPADSHHRQEHDQPLEEQLSVDLQPLDQQQELIDHQPVDHHPVDHQPVDHQPIDHKAVNYHTVEPESAQQALKKRKPCFSKCEVAVGVILMLLISACIGVVIYSSIKARNLEISHDGAVIMDYDNIVPLSDNGFPANLESVDLTLNITNDSTDDDVAINIYKGDCDIVTVVHTSLPIQPQNELWALDGFKRQPYNYKGQDMPIFGLKGSHLQFNITFTMTTDSSGRDHNTCLRLRIFTDYDSYWHATASGSEDPSPIVDGQIDQSDCLPIEEPVSWTYTFQTSSYVYATIDVGAGTTVNGSITGVINSYNPGSLPSMVSCSPLTRDSLTCSVELCGDVCYSLSQHPLQCIYLQQKHSDSNSNADTTPLCKVFYESKLPIHNSYFLISVLLATFIVLVFVFAVSLVCFKHCYCFLCTRYTREAKRELFSRQSSTDSTTPLLESTSPTK